MHGRGRGATSCRSEHGGTVWYADGGGTANKNPAERTLWGADRPRRNRGRYGEYSMGKHKAQSYKQRLTEAG